MSIRHQIILLISLTFAVILAIGGYAVFQAQGNAAEVKSVTEGVVPSAMASSDLVSELKQAQLAVMTLVYSPNEGAVAVSKEKLAAKKKALQEGLDLQLKYATSDAQRGLVQQARESLVNYFNSIDESVQFKLDGQREIAEANLYANVAQYQTELEAIVETIRIEKSRTKDAAVTALNSNLSQTAIGTLVITCVAILLLSIVGMLLYRRIASPIAKMQEAMSEIASSQDFSRQVPVEREDEIGRSIVAFNAMIAKIQESSALLKQKTTDMQTMLQHMPQGILTVVEGGVIHPEYSAYLETILETRNIAGNNLLGLVFSNTNLGADALSQLQAVAGACIGEDYMNFEFNQHLLVGEIEKTMSDGRIKVLDLNWSAITDDRDVIIRLMLCVRDVTELKILAAEAHEQKRELEIIGEILSVTQEKFHDFISSSIKFLDENELLIRGNPDHNATAIHQMFRNMHTIKGNARTYGLHHLTNIVHEAEQYYEELRKPVPSAAWDHATLLDGLLRVRDMIEHYARTNEVSLGRRGPGRRTGVEHYLMVDKQQIQETLNHLENINTSNIHELIAARDEVRHALRLLGTERIIEMLEGVFDSAPSLAKELHKVPPAIDVQDNGYVLRTQLGGTLKNIFMHLVRNAIDHGIETPDERKAAGKPPAGILRLVMQLKDGEIKLVLSDDGRGLNLAKIRKTALEKGLVAEGVHPTDEEIANLVFRPGFSTAEAVTEISGRGVGMDAVLNLAKREGGKIELRFTDSYSGTDFRQFETVISFPASLAESTDGRDISSKSPSTLADLHQDADSGLLANRA